MTNHQTGTKASKSRRKDETDKLPAGIYAIRNKAGEKIPNRYHLVYDVYKVDPTTGGRKRDKKWVTFEGPLTGANGAIKKRAKLITDVGEGKYADDGRKRLGEWLKEWLDKAIAPPQRDETTFKGYKRIIEKHITPKIGLVRLQALRPLDLEHYYAGLKDLSGSSKQVHHAILHSSLEAATKAGLVTRNVARLVSNKPKKGVAEDVLEHVWSAEEAAKFLTAAKAAGPQPAAFYALALDSGARRGELAALKWTDLDPQTGRLKIERQLKSRTPGESATAPEFKPTKTKAARAIQLSGSTLALLAAHRRHQSEIKMKNRTAYHDYGLVFAKEWGDLYNRAGTLGGPLQVNNIGNREFAPISKSAGVKRIKFHGLRHTCATLLLSAGTPANVVQRRLGHSKIEMTLTVYAHVLPSMQQDATDRLERLLHG